MKNTAVYVWDVPRGKRGALRADLKGRCALRLSAGPFTAALCDAVKIDKIEERYDEYLGTTFTRTHVLIALGGALAGYLLGTVR